MSVFGLRKKAKGIIKNALGLDEENPGAVNWDVPSADPPPQETFEEAVHQQEAAAVVDDEQVNSVTAESNDGDVKQPEPAQEGLELTLENVQEVFDDYVRPGLQSDGGDISLIKIEDNDIYVKLVGACGSCPSSSMTMKMGVEALLQEEFPTMRELIDVTSVEA